MKEALFLVIGAILAGTVAILQRHYEQWRGFQEDIGLIRDRFDQIPNDKLHRVTEVYESSLDELTAAVYRVRPYLLGRANRERLRGLLEAYRGAVHNPDSGLVPQIQDIADTMRVWPNWTKAKGYLRTLLDDMDDIGWLW